MFTVKYQNVKNILSFQNEWNNLSSYLKQTNKSVSRIDE